MARRATGSLATWRRDAIRRMVAARRSALAFIRRLPEPEVRRTRTQDRWSAKDVIAHLVTCDEETARRFRLIARGQADRIFWFESMADADRFNARSVARLRRLSLPALLRRMERASADLVTWLERLPAAALRDPSHRYTVVDWLPTPGWTHVDDHIDEIKTWWRNAGAGRGKTAASRRR